MLHFTKMNGAGNDFVLLDNRDATLHLSPSAIAKLCDRHRGIGADGLLMVEPAREGADYRMRYFNADGGEAEMCGNGARCFGRFAALIGNKTGSVSFETMAGRITAHLRGSQVQIAMSKPHSLAPAATLDVAGSQLDVHFVNTGVPHAVVWVDDLEATNVRALGAGLRYHPHFAPKGTNANFAKVLGPGSIAIRTYERGVEDETLACGTGMVASALIAHQCFSTTSPVSVLVRGGDTLEVAFEHSAQGYDNVQLTGPADFVFEGSVELPA